MDKLPEGWIWGCIPAVDCDSKDRVYVFRVAKHHLVIFDREGNFLDSWGADVLRDAHGFTSTTRTMFIARKTVTTVFTNLSRQVN